MGKIYFQPGFLSLLFLQSISFAQLPSVTQTSWHEGPSSSLNYYFDDPYFLEEEEIGWLSMGRLSLDYSMINETIYEGFTYGSNITVADFTGDGFHDVVLTISGQIILLENPGSQYVTDSSWEATSIGSSFYQPLSLSNADMDNDGDIDLILGCLSASGITWFENPGSSCKWFFHNISNMPVSSVDCGDIDNDGDYDVLFCSTNTDSMGWMNNLDGAGENWAMETICSTLDGPIFTALADIDSDDQLDAAVCCRLENKVYWFKRDLSDSTWTQHTIASISFPISVSSGDYNNDGNTDILACGQVENSVFICTNLDGSGTVWTVENLELNSNGTKSCLLLDLENDNDLDVVVANFIDDTVIILSNLDGTGQNTLTTIYHNDAPRSLCQIDSDSDGIMEIALLCNNSIQIQSVSPSEYSAAGCLTSSIGTLVLYTDDEWGDMTWESTEPAGTSICFQLRNSDIPDTMGEWSDTISTNGTYLGDIFPFDPAIYIQYRVFLNSENSEVSPILNSVSFGGYIGDISQQAESVNQSSLITVLSNPSHGVVFLTVRLPNETQQLSVYDISGRLVYNETLQSQSSTVTRIIEGLNAGVYHVTITAGNRVETYRVCVLY